MSRKLEGKVAIVTGAASGLGLATARRFAAEGARVVMTDIDEQAVRGAAAAISGTLAFAVDISDPVGVAAMVARTTETFGRVDALAHFAEIARDALVGVLTLEAWDAVLRVNLTGSFLVAQAVAREMTAQHSGSIVLTSSRAYFGNIGQSNYSASKGGVVSLMRTLALELGKDNVRVNALAPGLIDTPMTGVVPEELRARAVEATPLRRAGKPEEVAAAALFLVSDDSSFVTGQVLCIDGGRTTGFAPA